MNAAYPLTIDKEEFLPFGEEGELYVVHGWVPQGMLLEGALASLVEQTSWGEVAEGLDERPLRWLENDDGKPDDVYEKEVQAGFMALHLGTVLYGWARFWESGEREAPDDAYSVRYEDGGVDLSLDPAKENDPRWEHSTWLREH